LLIDKLSPLMEEHKKKIRDNLKIPVAQFDLNGRFVAVYESVSEAQRKLNNRALCSMFSRGKSVSKGYRFEKISKECFLAIAALRDDSDKHQWFTDGQIWVKSDVRCFVCNSLKFHKASINELIEHFKNK